MIGALMHLRAIMPTAYVAQAKLAFNGLPAFRRRLTAGLRGLCPHPQGNNFLDLLLEQCNANIVLGHRSHHTYVLTHLVPTKHY